MHDTQALERYKTSLREQLPSLTERFRVRALGIFGSHVRQEQREGSDLDVLVTFEEEPSLLTFIALENHLTDSLGVKVDLVMEDALKPVLGKRILRELVPV